MSWRERWREPGGGSELLRLSLPLILSNSIWTLQVTIDRIFLSRLGTETLAATMAAVMLFWTPFALLQNTANYATTFVAQYQGAGRPGRVGPAVWQSLWFSCGSGLAFLLLVPLAGPIVDFGGHSPAVQALEIDYFVCLCYSALPTLIIASVGSFFAGRGDSWTVLGINSVGLSVNALLDYAWIFGHWGFPAWGIVGAGWATVVGQWASALVGLGLMLRARHRQEFATLAGWRFDGELFQRLMRFGLPSGLQWALDCLAFTAFIFLVGRLGDAELAATNIAFTINMIAVLPALGIGQGVSILVGQRLGEDRPDLAERSTWSGFRIAWLYMALMAFLYIAVPEVFVLLFHTSDGEGKVAELVVVLLRFVAVYSLFDCMNFVFSFALRGAGDTRFVTLVSLVLAWPIMVLPTAAALEYGWGLSWSWAFCSGYIVALALTFLLRFVYGPWKSMRVIEAAVSTESVNQ